MKTLNLTEEQRINLEAFCEAQPGNVKEFRQFVRMADAFALSAERKEAVGLREITGGYLQWNGDALSDEKAEIRIDDGDAALLVNRLESMSFREGMARVVLRWLDPLLDQLKR